MIDPSAFLGAFLGVMVSLCGFVIVNIFLQYRANKKKGELEK